jgi:uncharacterized membrane protein
VIRSLAILLGVAPGVTAGWLLFAKSTMTTPLSGANPSAQINLIVHHPMVLAGVLVHTVDTGELINLYVQGVGVCGWLTVLLRPGFVYILPPANLLLLWGLGIRGPQERSVMRALWYMVLALISAVLIMVAVYLAWVHVGQDKVVGVQGRYFIPLLVLAGMTVVELVPSRRLLAPRWQSLTSIAVMSLAEIAAMDTTIIHAFHIF